MKATLIVAFGASALVASALTAQAPEPVDAGVIARIRDEGLNRSQVARVFHTLVDTIGPRLAASPAYLRAAEYMRDTATEFGLSNARLDGFEFSRGWTLERQTIEMIEPRYMPLLGYAEAWSPSTPGEVVASAVLLAGKSPAEVQAMQGEGRLKGAAILQAGPVTNFIATDRPQPTADAPPAPAPAARGRRGGGGGGGRGSAQEINAAIRESGAAVLLKPSRGMHGTVFVQAAARETPQDTLPKIVLAGEHYNLIARLLEQGTPVKLRVNVQATLTDSATTHNVIAEIPGVDPVLKDEVVMLGAHLDSWHTATGATDNADGSAAAIEAFRILKAIGVRPRRTLRLALWGAEEVGLLGSRAYVQAHLDGEARQAARAAISAYFNIDPGSGPIFGWYLENNAEVAPIFDAWIAPFKDLGIVRNVSGPIGNTDHVTFNRAGIPGFNPVQDYVDYDVREHHTNADTAERVAIDDLKQNAVILASFVYHAAMRDQKLPGSRR
jgi:hypothetical protein